MKNTGFIVLMSVLALMLQGCYSPSFQDSRQREVTVNYDDPVLNCRKILVFGELNQRIAEETIQKLLFLDGKSDAPVDLYIQTPGGELKNAIAMVETIKQMRSPVNTYAMGECNSGGVMLLAAGTGKRCAFPESVIVVHGIKVSGSPPKDLTVQWEDMYTNFWRQRAHLPDPWLPLPLGVVHILSARQALEYGLIDEIIDNKGAQ